MHIRFGSSSTGSYADPEVKGSTVAGMDSYAP